jgi:hypothetical protein
LRRASRTLGFKKVQGRDRRTVKPSALAAFQQAASSSRLRTLSRARFFAGGFEDANGFDSSVPRSIHHAHSSLIAASTWLLGRCYDAAVIGTPLLHIGCSVVFRSASRRRMLAQEPHGALRDQAMELVWRKCQSLNEEESTEGLGLESVDEVRTT